MNIVVDFRTGIPYVRDQKARNTCLAFAVTAAHNFHQNHADWFSVEYLFYHAVQKEPGQDPKCGLSFCAAESALRDEGQPEEAVWPYKSGAVGGLQSPPDTDDVWHHDSSWEFHCDVSKAISAIRSQPVVIGLRLSQGFDKSPCSPFLIDDDEIGYGKHAVLGVGLGTNEDGGHWLLIRNRWGSKWGDSGDAWLSSRFLAKNLIGHMKLE